MVVPHFHVEAREWRCTVSIATLELIIGDPPKKDLIAAVAWASAHQDELMRTWKALNP